MPRQQQKGRNDQAVIGTLSRTIEELASIADVADVLESGLRQIIEFDQLALFIKNTDSDTFSRARPHSHAHPENAVHEGAAPHGRR